MRAGVPVRSRRHEAYRLSGGACARRTLLSLTAGLLLVFHSVPCYAGLELDRQQDSVAVQGEHFRIVLDARRGGTLTSLLLFDGSAWNEVLAGPANGFPDLGFLAGEKEYRLGWDHEARFVETGPAGQDMRCVVEATLRASDGAVLPWQLRLEYTICPEGAVFVDFTLSLPAGVSAPGAASFRFQVNDTIRQGPRFRDDNVAKQGNGFPSARVAFGMNPARSFSNEIEVFLEEERPLSGRCGFEKEGPGRFTWSLGGDRDEISGPFEYKNTIALGVGAAVSGRPKSTVLGERVFHWVNWLDLEHWYPTQEQIDKMAAANGTMLILHMEWMKQRGSNGKPHADYRVPRNQEEMTRAIAYAHEKGLRVGLYMRGVESYAIETGFFEKYCERDRDGLYVDWNGPTAVSWHESQYPPETALGDRHISSDGTRVPAKRYFEFTRKLRALVGPEGFLIGHQGSFNSGILANLCFDAYLPGETGSDRLMFSDIAEAGYKGMMGGGVCMPWTLDLPAYRNAEGAAKMASWGVYPHLVMGMKAEHGEGVTFSLEADAPEYAFIMPYWRLLSHLDVDQAVAFNLPGQNQVALKTSDQNIQSMIYRTQDEFLIIVANLGPSPLTAILTPDRERLGMSGAYQVTRINAETGDLRQEGAGGDSFSASLLPPWGMEGFKLTPKIN